MLYLMWHWAICIYSSRLRTRELVLYVMPHLEPCIYSYRIRTRVLMSYPIWHLYTVKCRYNAVFGVQDMDLLYRSPWGIAAEPWHSFAIAPICLMIVFKGTEQCAMWAILGSGSSVGWNLSSSDEILVLLVYFLIFRHMTVFQTPYFPSSSETDVFSLGCCRCLRRSSNGLWIPSLIKIAHDGRFSQIFVLLNESNQTNQQTSTRVFYEWLNHTGI